MSSAWELWEKEHPSATSLQTRSPLAYGGPRDFFSSENEMDAGQDGNKPSTREGVATAAVSQDLGRHGSPEWRTLPSLQGSRNGDSQSHSSSVQSLWPLMDQTQAAGAPYPPDCPARESPRHRGSDSFSFGGVHIAQVSVMPPAIEARQRSVWLEKSKAVAGCAGAQGSGTRGERGEGRLGADDGSTEPDEDTATHSHGTCATVHMGGHVGAEDQEAAGAGAQHQSDRQTHPQADKIAVTGPQQSTGQIEGCNECAVPSRGSVPALPGPPPPADTPGAEPGSAASTLVTLSGTPTGIAALLSPSKPPLGELTVPSGSASPTRTQTPAVRGCKGESAPISGSSGDCDSLGAGEAYVRGPGEIAIHGESEGGVGSQGTSATSQGGSTSSAPHAAFTRHRQWLSQGKQSSERDLVRGMEACTEGAGGSRTTNELHVDAEDAMGQRAELLGLYIGALQDVMRLGAAATVGSSPLSARVAQAHTAFESLAIFAAKQSADQMGESATSDPLSLDALRANAAEAALEGERVRLAALERCLQDLDAHARERAQYTERLAHMASELNACKASLLHARASSKAERAALAAARSEIGRWEMVGQELRAAVSASVARAEAAERRASDQEEQATALEALVNRLETALQDALEERDSAQAELGRIVVAQHAEPSDAPNTTGHPGQGSGQLVRSVDQQSAYWQRRAGAESAARAMLQRLLSERYGANADSAWLAEQGLDVAVLADGVDQATVLEGTFARAHGSLRADAESEECAAQQINSDATVGSPSPLDNAAELIGEARQAGRSETSDDGTSAVDFAPRQPKGFLSWLM